MLCVIEEGPGRPASNREGILRSGPIGKSPRWSSLTGKGPERWARVKGGKVPLGSVPKDQVSIGRVLKVRLHQGGSPKTGSHQEGQIPLGIKKLAPATFKAI